MKWWIWPLVILVLALGAAWMFRYQPMKSISPTLVWDRWLHRPCVAVGLTGQFFCTQEDVK